MSSDPIYFANKPREELAPELFRKIDDYYDFLSTQGRLRVWQRLYDYYYRGYGVGGKIQRTGQQDEYSVLSVNEYRNILLHLIVAVTSGKLAPEPKSTNGDYQSQSQTTVARGILDYYTRTLRLDSEAKSVCEMAVALTEGYMTVEWDSSKGEPYAVDQDGRPIMQGDIVIDKFTALDVIRDVTRDQFSGNPWLITRKFVNKYDYAAKYPELAERILSLSTGDDTLRNLRFTANRPTESDQVPLFRFYHEKTPAVPEGKFVELFSDDVVTIEGPLQYDEMPIYEMVPEVQIKSTFGYSVAYELLPMQEAIYGLYSIVMTNQSTFGVQNIAMPNGAKVNVNVMAEGLNVINYDPKFGPPQAMNLVQTPPEIFNFIQTLTQRMETIAGLNSVVRGNPEASLKSGAALALVASQAIQFNSGLSQAYASFMERVWTAIINILKRYATTPRMIAIAGKSNRSRLKEFKADDVNDISRVTVDLGNPLSRTIAGKTQIADQLLGANLVETAEQYINVLETGRLEPLTNGFKSELDNINLENENLVDPSEGQVMALATDNHRLHIQEHKGTLSSPDARENPETVARVLSHIQEHINLMNSIDPTIQALNMINKQPAMAPQGPDTGAPAIGGPGGPIDATNPITQQAQSVNLPNMPQNPLEGLQ
jgi:hypothetical protein